MKFLLIIAAAIGLIQAETIVVSVEQGFKSNLHALEEKVKNLACTTRFEVEGHFSLDYSVSWNKWPKAEFEGRVDISGAALDKHKWKVQLDYKQEVSGMGILKKIAKKAHLHYHKSNFTASIEMPTKFVSKMLSAGFGGKIKKRLLEDPVKRITVMHGQDVFIFNLMGMEGPHYQCHNQVNIVKIIVAGKKFVGKIGANSQVILYDADHSIENYEEPAAIVPQGLPTYTIEPTYEEVTPEYYKTPEFIEKPAEEYYEAPVEEYKPAEEAPVEEFNEIPVEEYKPVEEYYEAPVETPVVPQAEIEEPYEPISYDASKAEEVYYDETVIEYTEEQEYYEQYPSEAEPTTTQSPVEPTTTQTTSEPTIKPTTVPTVEPTVIAEPTTTIQETATATTTQVEPTIMPTETDTDIPAEPTAIPTIPTIPTIPSDEINALSAEEPRSSATSMQQLNGLFAIAAATILCLFF